MSNPILPPRKRGRPTNADRAARLALTTAPIKERTDAEILKDTEDRLDILYRLAAGATTGDTPALIVSGVPGIGKTYNIQRAMENAKETRNTKYDIIRGKISPVNLYVKLWELREKGNVLVLDDTDDIFLDEDGIGLLKNALDSSEVRKINYLVESPVLREKHIPQGFDFRGSMIFITNIDFEHYIKNMGKNKISQHIQALLSRVLYLDLCLHNRHDLLIWLQHSVQKHGILVQKHFSKWEQDDILNWVIANGNDLRTCSIREVLKVATLFRTNPNGWRREAKLLLCK